MTPQATAHVLTAWSNFYAISGSAAAALTGLMFVVITFVASGSFEPKRHGISAYSTPTVVHFSTALITATLLAIPWHAFTHAAIVLGIAGAIGTAYTVRVFIVTRKLVDYEPDLEDWLLYTVIPLVAYVAYAGAAIALVFAPVRALYGLAACEITFLVLGIRNAWDVVTFIAVRRETEAASAAPAALAGEVRATTSPLSD